MKQQPDMNFEIEETVVLREGARLVIRHCNRCGHEVTMATPEASAFLFGSSEREIFRLLEAGLLHFTEHERVLICLDSIRLQAAETTASSDLTATKLQEV